MKALEPVKRSELSQKYVHVYNLTQTGQPICINEYATKIAQHSRTHVLQIDDFQAIGNPLQQYQVDESFKPHELINTSRKGRVRHIFCPQNDINQPHQFFSKCVEAKRRGVFQFPRVIDENHDSGTRHHWRKGGKTEQFIIDTRCKEEKERVKKNIRRTNFKK